MASHFPFLIHFQFSIVRNPPVTASLCHPPLGKEGILSAPLPKGSCHEVTEGLFLIHFKFSSVFLRKGLSRPSRTHHSLFLLGKEITLENLLSKGIY